jgi:hypothetical protein
MHPLLAKIIGRPAIANWRTHLKAATHSRDKFRQFEDQANSHEGAVVVAADKFSASPTPANFEVWIAQESRRASLAAIGLSLRQIAENAYVSALSDGGADKLIAATEEAEAVLADREANTRKEDAHRSEELGVPVESTLVFVEIDRMRESLRSARSWANTDLSQAAAALNTVIGS